VAGSGGVRMGEGATKVFGGSRGWHDRDQAGLLEPRRAVIEHRHDRGAWIRGLGEPPEARNLVGDAPAAAIRFPDGVHRVWPPVCGEVPALPCFWRISARRFNDIKGYAGHR
jgi:hypothetical protein